MKSCQVCNLGNDFYTTDHDLPDPVAIPGQHYHAEAWVQIASLPDAQSGAELSTLYLRVHQDSPFAEVETAMSPAVALSSSWQLLSVDFIVTKSAPSWDVFAGAVAMNGATPLGDCFLIDDLVVTRITP